MVQATAAALAVAAAIIAMPAQAATYPCSLVRWAAKNYTPSELEEMARKYRVTPKERAAALACLKEKK